MEKKVYRSRISFLLIGFILAIFVPIIIFMFQVVIIYEALFIVFGSFVIPIFMLLKINYVISGEKLYLKIWTMPIRTVGIHDIVSVERIYYPFYIPAISLKSLCLRFKEGSNFLLRLGWVISPVREQEFIEELETIDPEIYINLWLKKNYPIMKHLPV